MNDPLKQFMALRESLLKEKAALESRLGQINDALGHPGEQSSTSRKRARNAVSLKDAVVQVLDGKILSKPEILVAVQKLGYQFATRDPMNSLNTVLYSGKKFKNVDGKFTLSK
jgi:hypothetical protein